MTRERVRCGGGTRNPGGFHHLWSASLGRGQCPGASPWASHVSLTMCCRACLATARFFFTIFRAYTAPQRSWRQGCYSPAVGSFWGAAETSAPKAAPLFLSAWRRVTGHAYEAGPRSGFRCPTSLIKAPGPNPVRCHRPCVGSA